LTNKYSIISDKLGLRIPLESMILKRLKLSWKIKHMKNWISSQISPIKLPKIYVSFLWIRTYVWKMGDAKKPLEINVLLN
jgi:hypothetical protein